jgi:hypothetical protein
LNLTFNHFCKRSIDSLTEKYEDNDRCFIVMKRFTLLLVAASLTFAIGVAASIAWYLYHQREVITLTPNPFPQEVDEAPTVDFCDLLHNHNLYDGKMVRVSATYFGMFEGSGLYDLRCNDTEGSCSVRFDDYLDDDSYRELGKTLSDENNVSWDSEHGASRSNVTVVGRFHAAKGGGYGHLNGSSFEFAIAKIEQAKPADLSPYIVVQANGLKFISGYSEISKVFKVEKLDKVLASLPQSVWISGKEVGITSVNGSVEDKNRMERMLEEVTTILQNKGYQVRRLP